MDLIVATRNAHKVAEFAQILGPEFTVRDLGALPESPPVEETGSTFQENAILKARAAAALVPGLVVSDDSGLAVDALGGAPGVYSARYAGADATDSENVAKLLAELSGIGDGARSARFCCALALARDGEILATFLGTSDGRISDIVAGTTGFGYDPIFIPEGESRTFAELGAEAKNRLSHRARAIAQLRDYLRSSVLPS